MSWPRSSGPRATSSAAGALVEPLAPFLTQEMLDGLDHFWRMRSLIDIEALSPEKRATVLPFIRDWADSAHGLSGRQVFQRLQPDPGDAQGRRRRDGQASISSLSPTAPMTAFPAEWAMPSSDPMNPFTHIGFTVAFNMSEQPAASINCGFDDDGLPIGLQIVGRRFDDLGVLAVARAYEAIRSAAMRPWPEPP